MNASGNFQEDHSYISHIYLITVLDCFIFENLGEERKVITLPKPGKGPKFPKKRTFD
jgi:hypothetical protein